jgi:signal transduction histidine kinase
VTQLREIVVETLHDARRLAVELRPRALDDFGLVAALERLTETSPSRPVSRSSDHGLGENRLPGEVETALYRIVQEALTNVVSTRAPRT